MNLKWYVYSQKGAVGIFFVKLWVTKSYCMRTIAYLAVSCLTLLFVAVILMIVLFIKN